MELCTTSLQEVELNPNCSGQAQHNRPGTGPGCENTKPGSLLTVLHVSFMFESEVQMPSPASMFKRFHATGTNGHLDLNLSC